MKIAIPTNDGLTLAIQVNTALAYLVLTVELGEIVHQEKRLNNTNNVSVKEMTSFDMIRDCEVVILREIMEEPSGILKSPGKEIIRSNETIITSAIMHYLRSAYIKESNTCCCP
jgi:predicted Fe-Mo cluster-binding NifX family protein